MEKSEASVWISKGFVWSGRARMGSSEIVLFNSSNARWHYSDQCHVMFFLSISVKGAALAELPLMKRR